MRIFNKMKKTMLVLAASLFCANVAFADTQTVYSWESPDGTAVETGGKVMSSTNSWVKNGEIGVTEEHVNLKQTATDLTVDPNVATDYWTLRLSGNNDHIDVTDQSTLEAKDYGRCAHVVINLDQPLAEGDQITVTGFRNKNAANKVANLYIRFDDENGKVVELKDADDETPYANVHTEGGVDLDNDGNVPTSKTYTVPAEAAGLKTIRLSRSKSGTNVFITKFEITREVAASEPEVPAVDSLKAGEVNVLVAGKTYVLGKQYEMYQVQFTAEKDGFLNITPSQKVSSTSLKINGASSTFTKVNGGIEKKGIAAGSVFTGTFYCSGTPSAENVYELVVTFEEGTPYSPLALTLASPADGGEWSGAAQYKSYGTKGVPHYEFSTLISADVKASVKIGEKVYENIKLAVDGYNPKLDITALPDTLNEAIAAGLIKAGETFTLTLSGIVDKEFAANTLADQTFTYTLASTACTGVNPTANTSRTTMVTDVTFSFDGTVALADTAKFYMVNLANNEKTELTGEVVEGTSVKVTVPAVEGLLPRLYNIVATGVTTAEGDKVITYGNEPGKLVASYGTGNGYFKGVTSLQNWGTVCSLKGFTATYPGAVMKVDGIATDPITITKWNMDTYTEEEIPGVTLNYTISDENPNVIVFTLSEPITEPGSYAISVPQKHFWAKDTYTEEDAKLSTPKYAYYQAAIVLNIDVVEPTATDVTDKLVNPNFDDANASTGWTDGSKDLGFGESADAVSLKDGKIFVGNIVEHWESGNWTGDIAQTVKELPAGTYKFTMGAYVNKAGEAYIFANDSLSLAIEAGKVGEYAVYAELAEGADLKVGFNNVSGINWICLDNAHLSYYGEGTTVDMACKADWKATLAAVEELKASYATPVGVEALDAVIAAAKTATVQDYLASMKAVNEAVVVFKQANALNMIATATKADSIDVTFAIVNPNANNNIEGWTVEGNTNMRIMYDEHYSNQTNKYFDTNAWGDVMVGSMKQTIKNLPAGVYTLTAVARGAEGQTANVVINDNKVAVNVVGNQGGALGRGWSKYTVSDTLYAAGDLTIGTELNNTANAKWFSIDEFALSAYMCDEVAAVVALGAAVDSLNALVVEVEAYQKTLDAADETQASMSAALTQSIADAKAAAEAKESTATVRAAYNQLNMMYVQVVANLAGMEAQAAQTMMGEYENATDEAGLANAINKVYEIVSNMMSNPENTYTVADLDAAVEAMRTAKDAFVKENTKITEVSVSLTHTASSYCGGTAGDFTSTVDAEKEHINTSKFSGAWAGAAYAEFSVLLPEGVSIKSATLTWSGVGSGKNRTTDIMYVSAGEALDYETMQAGKANVNLSATKIGTVTFTANTTTDFTTDVTDAVKTIVEGGQNYIIFKFTNNAGGGDLVGKGAAEKAPVLTLETVDASSMTTYTVKYVDGEGNELKAAGVYDVVIGETATVSDEDKAAIYTEDNAKKYIYVSSDKESIVTVADSASNVITATFREAAKYNYSVEAVDDSGILARTLSSNSNFEGEKVAAPYNAYVLVDGVLYQAEKTNKEYNKYITLTEDNMKVQVVYAPTTIENVVYYQEAEDVEGLTKVTTGNTSIRSSNSASAYAAEADVVLTNLAPGKYKMAAVIYDATKALGSEFSFIAGADTILKAVSTAANWTACASEEFTLTANADLSLAKGGSTSKAVDFVYIQKTGDVAPRFDLTAYNDTVAWANEMKATLDATNESEAEVIDAIEYYIASAAEWLAEVEADPEATQADVDYIAQDLKAQVGAVMSRVQLSKLWPEAEALRAEADSVYASYTNPTDEAGLVDALRSFPRSPMFVTSVEELQAAMDALKAAMDAFIAENNNAADVTKIAYLNTKGDKDDAIYDALVAAGYAVDTLAYADVTLSEEIIDSELAGYDVVVLGGSTGSGTNLAKTANLLLGKVNVLSTKSFWYKHYGANGGNPGAEGAPSLSLTKAAGYEEHPIYAGIEGDEFAVFNDMGKSSGRYLQSNGSFSDAALAQATLGTTLGADCIGETWSNGFGYIIIPVDGLQPTGYLTADGAQLFVNAVKYLIAGEVYEFNGIGGVQVEGAQWPADIYDLSGRMIKKAATSLEGLEKGLYIVNGKKLLVK